MLQDLAAAVGGPDRAVERVSGRQIGTRSIPTGTALVVTGHNPSTVCSVVGHSLSTP